MAVELLQALEATDATFKIVALLAIACAYVLFELALTSARRGRRRERAGVPVQVPSEVAELAIEAYRPVTSWSSRSE